MRVHEAIESRRSIRRYTTDPVSQEDLCNLLWAAHLAPSGHNTQPWRFIVVQEARVRKILAGICHDQQWMMDAPVHVVVCADLGVRQDHPVRFDEETSGMEAKRVIRDTAISADHLMLRAVELGLGTCWVGWYDQEAVKPVLNVPDSVFVLGIITIGHPAEAPKARPRCSLAGIVFKGEWGSPYPL